MAALLLLVVALWCTSIAGEWPVPGMVKNLAGGFSEFGFLDGEGINARFDCPRGMAMDPENGNLFVADSVNYAIRVITPSGNVSTLARTLASTDSPYGLGFNEADRVLYVGVQSTQNRGYILQINVDSAEVEILLPMGSIPQNPSEPIHNPIGILYDNSKKLLYFSELSSALRVWVYPFTSPSTIQTLFYSPYGGQTWSFIRDKYNNFYMGLTSELLEIYASTSYRVAAGTSYPGYVNGRYPSFHVVEGLAWSADGDSIFMADNFNGVIRQVFMNGSATTAAGRYQTGFFEPGPTTGDPIGTFYDASEIYAHPYTANYYYIADQTGIRVWYGAPPNITNISVTLYSNVAVIDATIVVPLCAVESIIVTLQAQGYPQEMYNVTSLPLIIIPQYSNSFYIATIEASNEYGNSERLMYKFVSPK